MTAYEITGKRFGRLTVLKRAGTVPRAGSKFSAWKCRCDCGTRRTFVGADLVHGKIKSCGCYRREFVAASKTIHGHSAGGSVSSEYASWVSMKARCLNKQNHAFPNYGGRGITVCERWMTFDNFIADMGPKLPRQQVERIDNNGNYEPGNCIWSGAKAQARNRRSTVMLALPDGKLVCMKDFAKFHGVNYQTMSSRKRRGDPLL